MSTPIKVVNFREMAFSKDKMLAQIVRNDLAYLLSKNVYRLGDAQSQN